MDGISALATYTAIDKIEQRRSAAIASAAFTRDLNSFKTDIAKVDTLDGIFKNTKLLTTILKAYDLESSLTDIAKLKEILTSKLSDPKSLVNTQSDKRYLDLANDIDLYSGYTKIKSAAFAAKLQARLEDRYLDPRLEPQQKIQVTNSPLFKKDIADFKAAAAKIDSVDKLFKNYKLLKTVLEAYGLDSEIDKAGFIKKILTSDPSDKSSLVNRANDPRYRELALDIGLYNGVDGLKSSAFANRLQDKLAEIRFENNVEDQTPGVRAALHFRQSAPNIKTPYDILSDPALRDVVFKTFGIPLEVVRQPVESQARLLQSHIKFDKLSDPNYASRIIRQYLVLMENQPAASGNGALLDLFA